MASNRYAAPETTYADSDAHGHFDGAGAATAVASFSPEEPGYPDFPDYPDFYGPQLAADEPHSEWNPSTETVRPVRGRHRVARQRGGTMARSRAVLGVGVIAAVGAGGMATAQEGGAGTVPGMDAASESIKAIPAHLPVVGDLVSSGDADEAASGAQILAAAPLTTAGLSEDDIESGQVDAGEALRARILQQADQQEAEAEADVRAAAVAAAEAEAARAAEARAAAEQQAEEERRRQEEEERRRREEAERLRELRESYSLPLPGYSPSHSFGATGSLWQSTHTGEDFSAPSGTPVRNVHTGTVTEAAWAGSYGYRVIVELSDGTEIWYCHLSSMNVVAGQEVATQDTVGLVGSTGNSTGAHLHLEIRPGGGDPVDPLAWLRGKGLSV